MLPGRVVRRKGHTLLLRAIERLRRRNFVCLLVGDVESGSTYPGEVEGLIGAIDLREVVRMVGACDDMPAALMLADVVVVPSTQAPEPFGRVAVEAQAMGKPVVVTDIGGLGETLMPAATGWLVPPDDVDELARALQLALAMPDGARARLADRARRFVLRSFTLEQMGRGTLAVYRELLEGARRTPIWSASPRSRLRRLTARKADEQASPPSDARSTRQAARPRPQPQPENEVDEAGDDRSRRAIRRAGRQAIPARPAPPEPPGKAPGAPRARRAASADVRRRSKRLRAAGRRG